MKLVARFLKNESGATAIEYGLIAALISVVIIGIVGNVGTSLTATFETVNGGLGGVVEGGGGETNTDDTGDDS